MDVLSPLLLLLFRAIVVVLPLTVALLALRRLLLSQSENAWIYAITCLFASATTIGLVPWTLGLSEGSWLLFMFSTVSPVMWMSVIMICDPIREPSAYDSEDLVEMDFGDMPPLPLASRPLILEKPDWPEAPVPIFRHMSTAANKTNAPLNLVDAEEPGRSVMAAARGMRGNENSDARRPKMLPPPRELTDLPFLHRN